LRPTLNVLDQTIWADRSKPEADALAELANTCARADAATGITSSFKSCAAHKQLKMYSVDASVGDFTQWHRLFTRNAELEHNLRTRSTDIGDPKVAIQTADVQVATTGQALLELVAANGYVRSYGPHSIQTTKENGPITDNVRDTIASIKGWACTNLAARMSLPLTAGLFDVAIIDEASQCSIAAALPIMYRAKQVIFIGDPNQLSPITNVSKTAHPTIAKDAGFDADTLYSDYRSYPDWSIWHYAQQMLTEAKTHFLDLHFRCHPSIARWFNTTFYNDKLTIVTALTNIEDERKGLIWQPCNGTSERKDGHTCFNRTQTKVAAQLVRDLATNTDATIGVVTPFSAQAELIEFELRKAGVEGRAKVATAHKFQGDECDHIIFSTTVDPNTPKRTLEWVESNRNLMNVAASRARRSLIVLGHPALADLHATPTLASLVRAARDGLRPAEQGTNTHSIFEEIIIRDLHQARIPFLLKPVEDGYELDIAVLKLDRKFDIEIDGIHHIDHTANGGSRRRDIARDQALIANGWTVHRIPTWRIAAEHDTVISELLTVLG
jgi:very-short-patch-repair endonuclease